MLTLITLAEKSIRGLGKWYIVNKAAVELSINRHHLKILNGQIEA
jgi:hypothetical protein